MNVMAGIDQEIDLADNSTFMAFADVPELVDGQIPAEFWAIVAPVSHVALRTKTTSAITDQTLAQMSQHKGLLGLNISGPFNVTPDGLGKLSNCPDFRMLFLHGQTPISPALLDAISQIAELRQLAMGGRPMTPNVVPAILRLKNLESLSLRETGIDDADIAQLGSLTKLTFLDLDQSKMTDEGLRSLNGLANLRLLAIRGSNISQQVLSDFQAAHPHCRIHR
jgi:Leucine-rich repeat (LRR) protein